MSSVEYLAGTGLFVMHKKLFKKRLNFVQAHIRLKTNIYFILHSIFDLHNLQSYP